MSVKIGRLTFPHAAVLASGAQSFFGDDRIDYQHHKLYKLIPGFSFKNSTFCAKTVTAFPREGNTELKQNGTTVKKLFPDSIWVNLKSFIKGAVSNAVGLSNPGIKAILDARYWQLRDDTFMISFMPVGKTKEEILRETEYFCQKMASYYTRFANIAIQVNLSCPNTGHDIDQYLDNALMIINELKKLEIPLIPKISIDTAWKLVHQLCDLDGIDALCISNTKPWKNMSNTDRKKYFGTTKSPLEKYGGGGVSGKPLLEDVIKWIAHYENLNFANKLPLIHSGGILNTSDVKRICKFKSVKMISIGSVAILRPWKLQSVIRTINKYCK